MTIEADASEISYSCDGVTTTFAIPFPFDTSTDLKVILTDSSGNPSTLSTGFTVSGGGGSTGTLTTSTAYASGYTLTVLDDPERTQVADYTDNDSFPAEVHEAALDRNTRITKRLYQLTQQAVRVADGDPRRGTGVLLPSVASGKGKYLRMNSTTGEIEAADVSTTVGALSRSIISDLLNPQTTAESAASVTPSPTWPDEGDLYRYGATGDGAADDLTALTRANSVSIQTKGPTTRVHRGTFRISNNLTITEDLDFSRGGGLISVDAGKTLTIAGRVTGPARQYFTGSGSVVFLPGKNEYVHPEWWGAIPDDSTDCYAAILKAIAALPTGGSVYGGIVHLLKGLYRTSGKIVLPNGVEIRGVSCNTSCIKAANGYSQTSLVENALRDGTQEFVRLRDLMLDGNKASATISSAVVDFVSMFVNSYIRDVLIQNGSNNNLRIGAAGTPGGGGPFLVDNVWGLSPGGHNCVIDETVGNAGAIAGINLHRCTFEHQASGMSAIIIQGQGKIGSVNILDCHIEQQNTGANTYALYVDGVNDLKVDGLQVQSASSGSGGIVVTSNVNNNRYSFKNVTNINVVNPILNDQKASVQFGGVHVPWYGSPDFGLHQDRTQTLTYGASVATDLTLGNYCILVITNGTAFTIANPTKAQVGERLTYEIVNSSGGAHGTISWGANFAYRDSSLGAIANGKRRTITFEYRGSNQWAQIGAATGDM